jgi:tryptophan 2,3-dioxygenase
MNLTYLSYLKIPELLELQKLQSQPEEHDEMLFIVIHQTYELWFKQILHEFGRMQGVLRAGLTWDAIKTLRRILTILKTLVSQIDILETMTPLQFLSFRNFLQDSSGFQSRQFRELEILLGLRYTSMTAVHPELLPKLEDPILWDAFIAYLRTQGYDLPDAVRENTHGLVFSPTDAMQTVLIDVMTSKPEAGILCELMVDFDEGLQEWRYRHVKMVERTIGTKKGTGGSDGVEYLKRTLFLPVFPDLWAIRTSF